MVVENEIIIKQRRKNKTAGNSQKFRADAGCSCRVIGINPKTLARWIYQQRLEARQNQNNVEFVELKRTVVKIRQGIIIRKAGIEIEMPSFDASSLKEILKAVNLTYAKLTELRSLLTGNYIRLWQQKLKEILLSDFFFLQKRLSEPCA